MSSCPHARLLHLENFGKGTPRGEIARLRESGERLIWEEDDYANGGHWLVLQRDDIDTVEGLLTPTWPDAASLAEELLHDGTSFVRAILRL